MIYDYNSTKEYLVSEFEYRVKKNPRYSIRGFAKLLNVHPAEISLIFKGKRNLSFPSAFKVAKALNLNSQETKHLLSLLQNEKGQAFGLPLNIEESSPLTKIDLELFGKVCNWYHFAILNLIDSRQFEWSARHISSRLGISQSEAKIAMDDLIKTRLVELTSTNKKISAKAVQVNSDFPSHAIRKYHREILEKAILSLDEVSVDQREFQSIGFVTDPSHVPALKKEIRNFSNQITKKFHKDGGQSVYQIQVCLFPLSQENKK